METEYSTKSERIIPFPIEQSRLAFNLGYQRPNIKLPENLDKIYSEAREIRRIARKSESEIAASIILNLNKETRAA